MKPILKLFVLLFIFAFAARTVLSQQPEDLAVKVITTINDNPPSITLTWDTIPGDSVISIHRKNLGDVDWGEALAVLNPNATEFTDNSVEVGRIYEYRILKNSSFFHRSRIAKNYTSYDEWYADWEPPVYFDAWPLFNNQIITYVCSGIRIPEVEHRGKVILLVDSTFVDSLNFELSRFESDLLSDGWKVLRKDVSRNASVKYVKSLVRTCYFSDTANVKSLILFGHIPIPYSGCDAYDGHEQEAGAWQADLYYGSMNEEIWTDEFVNCTPAMPVRKAKNINIPGDGKFDQTVLPPGEKIVLQIGRIDLSDLPAFNKSETELMRNYLNKDHAFRYKQNNPKMQALIVDYDGWMGGNPPALNGWRNFSALFNPTQVEKGSYLNNLRADSYLWVNASGTGDSDYTGRGCTFTNTATQLAVYKLKNVFGSLFASAIANWDYPDNVLRASLASEGWMLTCCWAGFPLYTFHQMGMGESIGFCIQATQNNEHTYDYLLYNRRIHIGMQGDPTLRMHIVSPVNSLQSAVTADSTILLAWKQADDSILGYHVYKLDTLVNEYQRITGEPVTNTWFEDTLPAAGNNYYMVKSYQLTQSASGSYYNLSQGVFDTINYKTKPAVPVDSIELYFASSNQLPLITYNPVKVNALVFPDSATNKLLKWSILNVTANGKLDVDGNLLADRGGRLILIAESLDGSGVTDSLEINIDSIPYAAGAITGDSEPCLDNHARLYTVPEIRGASAYQWTLPDGSTDTTLLNEVTYVINNSAVSGILTVKGITPYAEGEESTLNITIYDIPEPPEISIVDNAFVSNVATGNQWYRNDTLIEGATDDTYIPTMDGIYTSRVTVNNCSSAKSNKIRWTDIEVSAFANQIHIYPNPATGELTIEFEKLQTTNTKVELLDISGKVIYTATINPGNTQHQINLSSFEEGLYLIRISNTDYTVAKKVIKVE